MIATCYFIFLIYEIMAICLKANQKSGAAVGVYVARLSCERMLVSYVLSTILWHKNDLTNKFS